MAWMDYVNQLSSATTTLAGTVFGIRAQQAALAPKPAPAPVAQTVTAKASAPTVDPLAGKGKNSPALVYGAIAVVLILIGVAMFRRG